MKISTVIPHYNDSFNLKICLESIKTASPGPLEVIIVDDSSTQEISGILKTYPFARLIRLNRRGGPGFARYAGIQSAKGDVVAFLDSDCVISPDWYAVIERNLTKDIGGIAGGYIINNRNNFFALYEIIDIYSCYKTQPRNESVSVIGGCCAFWRHIFDEVDLTNTFLFNNFAAGEDTILGYEVRKKYRIENIDVFFVYHRFNETLYKYLRKCLIMGYSRTVISKLYHVNQAEVSHHDFSYIFIQLILTLGILIFLTLFLVTKTALIIVFIISLLMMISEAGFLRQVVRLRDTKKSKKFFLIMARPLLSLTRNIFWLAGIAMGISYPINRKHEKISL